MVADTLRHVLAALAAVVMWVVKTALWILYVILIRVVFGVKVTKVQWGTGFSWVDIFGCEAHGMKAEWVRVELRPAHPRPLLVTVRGLAISLGSVVEESSGGTERHSLCFDHPALKYLSVQLHNVTLHNPHGLALTVHFDSLSLDTHLPCTLPTPPHHLLSLSLPTTITLTSATDVISASTPSPPILTCICDPVAPSIVSHSFTGATVSVCHGAPQAVQCPQAFQGVHIELFKAVSLRCRLAEWCDGGIAFHDLSAEPLLKNTSLWVGMDDSGVRVRVKQQLEVSTDIPVLMKLKDAFGALGAGLTRGSQSESLALHMALEGGVCVKFPSLDKVLVATLCKEVSFRAENGILAVASQGTTVVMDGTTILTERQRISLEYSASATHLTVPPNVFVRLTTAALHHLILDIAYPLIHLLYYPSVPDPLCLRSVQVTSPYVLDKQAPIQCDVYFVPYSPRLMLQWCDGTSALMYLLPDVTTIRETAGGITLRSITDVTREEASTVCVDLSSVGNKGDLLELKHHIEVTLEAYKQNILAAQQAPWVEGASTFTATCGAGLVVDLGRFAVHAHNGLQVEFASTCAENRTVVETGDVQVIGSTAIEASGTQMVWVQKKCNPLQSNVTLVSPLKLHCTACTLTADRDTLGKDIDALLALVPYMQSSYDLDVPASYTRGAGTLNPCDLVSIVALSCSGEVNATLTAGGSHRATLSHTAPLMEFTYYWDHWAFAWSMPSLVLTHFSLPSRPLLEPLGDDSSLEIKYTGWYSPQLAPDALKSSLKQNTGVAWDSMWQDSPGATRITECSPTANLDVCFANCKAVLALYAAIDVYQYQHMSWLWRHLDYTSRTVMNEIRSLKYKLPHAGVHEEQVCVRITSRGLLDVTVPAPREGETVEECAVYVNARIDHLCSEFVGNTKLADVGVAMEYRTDLTVCTGGVQAALSIHTLSLWQDTSESAPWLWCDIGGDLSAVDVASLELSNWTAAVLNNFSTPPAPSEVLPTNPPPKPWPLSTRPWLTCALHVPALGVVHKSFEVMACSLVIEFVALSDEDYTKHYTCKWANASLAMQHATLGTIKATSLTHTASTATSSVAMRCEGVSLHLEELSGLKTPTGMDEDMVLAEGTCNPCDQDFSCKGTRLVVERSMVWDCGGKRLGFKGKCVLVCDKEELQLTNAIVPCTEEDLNAHHVSGGVVRFGSNVTVDEVMQRSASTASTTTLLPCSVPIALLCGNLTLSALVHLSATPSEATCELTSLSCCNAAGEAHLFHSGYDDTRVYMTRSPEACAVSIRLKVGMVLKELPLVVLLCDTMRKSVAVMGSMWGGSEEGRSGVSVSIQELTVALLHANLAPLAKLVCENKEQGAAIEGLMWREGRWEPFVEPTTVQYNPENRTLMPNQALSINIDHVLVEEIHDMLYAPPPVLPEKGLLGFIAVRNDTEVPFMLETEEGPVSVEGNTKLLVKKQDLMISQDNILVSLPMQQCFLPRDLKYHSHVVKAEYKPAGKAEVNDTIVVRSRVMLKNSMHESAAVVCNGCALEIPSKGDVSLPLKCVNSNLSAVLEVSVGKLKYSALRLSDIMKTESGMPACVTEPKGSSVALTATVKGTDVKITLLPMFEVVNALPVPVMLTLHSTQSQAVIATVSPGGISPLLADPAHEYSLAVVPLETKNPSRYTVSERATIHTGDKKHLSDTIKVTDTVRDYTFTVLTSSVVDNDNCVRRVCVYTSYWVRNLTTFSDLYVTDGHGVRGGFSNEGILCPSDEVLMWSKAQFGTSELAVKQGKREDAQFLDRFSKKHGWSEFFNVDLPETTMGVTFSAGESCNHIAGVEVARGKGVYHRTKVISIMQGYVAVNKTPVIVALFSKSSQLVSLQAGERSCLTLADSWTTPSEALQKCHVKVTHHGTTFCSSTFNPGTIGSISLKLRKGADFMTLACSISIQGPTLCITFEPEALPSSMVVLRSFQTVSISSMSEHRTYPPERLIPFKKVAHYHDCLGIKHSDRRVMLTVHQDDRETTSVISITPKDSYASIEGTTLMVKAVQGDMGPEIEIVEEGWEKVKEEKNTWGVGFVGDMEISYIAGDGLERRESFYHTARNVRVQGTVDSTHGYNIAVSVGSFQIDNSNPKAEFKVVLCSGHTAAILSAQEQREQSTIEDFFKMSFTGLKATQNVIKCETAVLAIRELTLTVDDVFAYELFNIIKTWKGFGQATPPQHTVLSLKSLDVHPMKFYVTFENGNVVTEEQLPLVSLMKSVSDVPVSYPALCLANVFSPMEDVAKLVLMQYKTMSWALMYRTLLSLEFLGNPVGLLGNVGDGIADLFYEPVAAFRNEGTVAEVAGSIGRGAGSLAGGVAYGVTNTATGITGSLGKSVAELSFDDEYLRRRRQQGKEKPRTFGEGVLDGANSLASGIGEGIKGVINKPVEGVKEGGLGGLITGVGKGLVGVVVKPAAGVLDLATKATEGMKNMVVDPDAQGKRARHTRVLLKGVLAPYDPSMAAMYHAHQTCKRGKYRGEKLVGFFPAPNYFLVFTLTRLVAYSVTEGEKLWGTKPRKLSRFSFQNATLCIEFLPVSTGPFTNTKPPRKVPLPSRDLALQNHKALLTSFFTEIKPELRPKNARL